jgi:CheY-like chemotaxis protein
MLPLAFTGEDRSPVEPEHRPEKSSEPRSSFTRSGILLVEDNPADALLVREALKEHKVDCELTVIADGEKAIHFLTEIQGGLQGCPDLIILDLNLPRRSGREVLEYIRGSMGCGQVPVVILSSSDRQKDRDETASLGITRYLRKPSRLEEFIALGAVFKEIVGANS